MKVPLRSLTPNVLPCKSRIFAPLLEPMVSVFRGATFVVARTTIKKSEPLQGADAKFIWFSTIVNDIIGSWIIPPKDTINVYGLPGKNAWPPNVRLKVVLTLSNCELISSSYKNEPDDCWRPIYAI